MIYFLLFLILSLESSVQVHFLCERHIGWHYKPPSLLLKECPYSKNMYFSLFAQVIGTFSIKIECEIGTFSIFVYKLHAENI